MEVGAVRVVWCGEGGVVLDPMCTGTCPQTARPPPPIICLEVLVFNDTGNDNSKRKTSSNSNTGIEVVIVMLPVIVIVGSSKTFGAITSLVPRLFSCSTAGHSNV